jgi:hypothetical protein
MSTTYDLMCIEESAHRPIFVGRRQFLGLFLPAAAMLGAVESARNLEDGRRRMIVINGWILLEDDVWEIAGRVG